MTGPVTTLDQRYSDLEAAATGRDEISRVLEPAQVEDEMRYLMAASAEAAVLRTCLSCRPNRLPQSLSRSAPELICRAVRMILAGTLDHGTEASLAARLGMSSRHLRRLFIACLGVTPDGLARSRRAHFARQLLDDTDLPVTEIAYAAGFGSIRQFNRECLRIFRTAPSQLRAKRSEPGRLAADGGLTLRLSFTGPLDWDALASFLAARAVRGVEHVDGQTYRRTIVVDGDPGMIELSPGDRDHLRLRVHLPRWADLMHVAAQARRIACLDADTSEPARSLAGDLVIGPLLAARPGVRVPGAWDQFEVGVAAIIGQWLDGETSRAVMARLVGRMGREVPGLDAVCLSHTFPAPGILARAGTDLQAIGLNGDQAETLVSYAAAADNDIVRLDGSMKSDQLISSIMAIPGITASAAHYIALRMGEPDAFPASDPALQKALGHFAGNLSPDRVLRWQPWRSYAAAHLWAAA